MQFAPRPARTVSAPSVDAAVTTLLRFGFHEHERREGAAVLKKPGDRFSFRAHQRPLEARVRTAGPGEVELGLRYDQFVVVDTGDLARHVDRLAAAFD